MTLRRSPPITHIVLFRYRSDISWTELQNHFDSLQPLQRPCLHPDTGKPYMLSLRMGKNNSWEPFSKGMTHGFVLEFASQEELDYYLLRDPIHADFSRKAHPLFEDSLVVDIKDGVLFGPAPKKPIGLGGIWKGSCHCGGCEWEVRSEEQLKHILCLCDTCKKLGGGPHSCNHIVSRENLEIVKGSPKVCSYKGASGKEVHCFFCPTCTSHIYHHQDVAPENVIVRILLLEEGNDLEAGGEIFAEGMLPWADDLRRALQTSPSVAKTVNGVNAV